MAFASKFALVSSMLVMLILMINVKPSLTQSTGDLINVICRSTEDFGFCNTTFYANLKSPNANIADLTQLTIEVATTQAKQTLDFIKQTLETTTDPSLKSALGQCQDAYVQITQSYQTAMVLFLQPDYWTLEKVERPTAKIEAGCEATEVASQHVMDQRSREMRLFIVMSMNAVQTLLGTKGGVGLARAGAPSPL